MGSTCITKKKGWLVQVESGVPDLVRTTSSTSFTWPITFGKRRHSLPYNIFYAFPTGKIGTLVVPKFWIVISFLI
jgi:hypothetical protein